MPHETLAEYNRRVESILRPSVSHAIKSANAVKAAQERQVRMAKAEKKRKARGEHIDDHDSEVDGGDGEGNGAGGGRKRNKGNTGNAGNAGPSNGHIDGKQTNKDNGSFEFAPIPAPRRLNDIVQAPPSLPHLRLSTKNKPTTSGGSGGGEKGNNRGSAWKAQGTGRALSAAQERILGEERERVIKRYREMKAEREAAKGAKMVQS